MEPYATNWPERTNTSRSLWETLLHWDPTEEYTRTSPRNPGDYKRDSGLLKPWGQYIRTVTDGKIKGGAVAERKSQERPCAKRRSTIKSSSAYCVQR